MVLRSGSISNSTPGMQWKITKQSDGTYTVQAKTGESGSRYLAPCSSSNNSHVLLTQRTYSSSDAEFFQWRIMPIDEVTMKSVTVYYDYAYPVKFSNYNTRMDVCLDSTTAYYLNTFQIYLSFDAPTSRQSYADTCPNASISSICNCVGEDGCEETAERGAAYLKQYHHTNSSNILFRVERDSSRYATLAFIGRLVCYKNGSECKNDVYGQQDPGHNVCIVMNNSTIEGETKSVAHELGHCMGAFDHNGDGDSSDFNEILEDKQIPYRFSASCIYGEGKTKLNEIVICEACQAVIRGDLSEADVNY